MVITHLLHQNKTLLNSYNVEYDMTLTPEALLVQNSGLWVMLRILVTFLKLCANFSISVSICSCPYAIDFEQIFSKVCNTPSAKISWPAPPGFPARGVCCLYNLLLLNHIMVAILLSHLIQMYVQISGHSNSFQTGTVFTFLNSFIEI